MAEVNQRRWFDDYIAALNRDDLEAVAAFYAPDLHLTDGMIECRSARAAMEGHHRLRGRVMQRLEVVSYIDRPGRIAAEIRKTEQAQQDVPDFPGAPLAKGEQRTSIGFVMYDIADGCFIRIRAAPYKAAP